MYTVHADVARNRLELVVQGRPTDDELRTLVGDVKRELQRVRPGFVAAVDLHAMAVLTTEQTQAMATIQGMFVAAKPSKIGTLIDSAILQMQLNRVGKGTGIESLSRRFGNDREWRAFVG